MFASVLVVQLVAIAAAWLLRARERQLRQQLPYLVSLAVGVLLATALLHLLPESIEALGNGRGPWLATGLTLLSLFSIERLFHAFAGASGAAVEPLPAGLARDAATVPAPHDPLAQRSDLGLEQAHAHGPACQHLHPPSLAMRPANLLLGSSLHSFVDGTAIATAFAVSRQLGLLTAFAVALHEVPHRLGDVAVLLHLGVPAPRAMRFAVVAGVPALLGALAVLTIGHGGAAAFRWLLPVSAGSFLYIAGVNLLPELQLAVRPRAVLLELLCLLVGVGIVVLVTGIHAGLPAAVCRRTRPGAWLHSAHEP